MPNERGEGKGWEPAITLSLTGVLSLEGTLRVLVVLYHVGDALARNLERAKVSDVSVTLWCSDWEDAVSGCSSQRGLGWLKYSDSLVRLVNRYVEMLADREPNDGQG